MMPKAILLKASMVNENSAINIVIPNLITVVFYSGVAHVDISEDVLHSATNKIIKSAIKRNFLRLRAKVK